MPKTSKLPIASYEFLEVHSAAKDSTLGRLRQGAINLGKEKAIIFPSAYATVPYT